MLKIAFARSQGLSDYKYRIEMKDNKNIHQNKF